MAHRFEHVTPTAASRVSVYGGAHVRPLGKAMQHHYVLALARIVWLTSEPALKDQTVRGDFLARDAICAPTVCKAACDLLPQAGGEYESHRGPHLWFEPELKKKPIEWRKASNTAVLQ